MTIITYSKTFKKPNIFTFRITNNSRVKKSKFWLVFWPIILILFISIYIYIINLQTAFSIKNRHDLTKIEKIKEKNNILEANLGNLTSVKKFKEIAKKYNYTIILNPLYLKENLAIR